MYHCHMLSHEDEGMMGQFLVVGNPTRTNQQDQYTIRVHPNPFGDFLHLTGLPPAMIKLYNISGQQLQLRESKGGQEKFNVSDFSPGIYFFNIITPEANHTYKVIKH